MRIPTNRPTQGLLCSRGIDGHEKSSNSFRRNERSYVQQSFSTGQFFNEPHVFVGRNRVIC